MITRRTLATLAALPFLLVACGGDDNGDGAEPAQNDGGGSEPADNDGGGGAEAEEDPYEVYLEIAPEKPDDWGGDWPLSREDAQTRAMLGCEEDFAAGTVDAALAEAYADLCD